jgi:aldose sugar dehydrogenase
VDPDLGVSTVVNGLDQPIAMAFIGPNDILVTEKASGQVKRDIRIAYVGRYPRAA